MRAERGAGTLGFLLGVAIAVGILLLGFKLVPAYIEYATIRKELRALAADPGLASASRADIESAYARRATAGNLVALAPRDLEITRLASGLVLSAAYTTRVPLFGNVAACLEFHPSSAD